MRPIAENLKALRTQAGLSQEQLGLGANVKQSAISRYERDEDVPEVGTILRLAAGLNVPVEALLKGVDAEYDRLIASNKPESQDPDLESAQERTAAMLSESGEDPDLLDEPTEADGSPTLASARDKLATILAEGTAVLNALTAITENPGRQTAMARAARSVVPPRNRAPRRQPHRKG